MKLTDLPVALDTARNVRGVTTADLVDAGVSTANVSRWNRGLGPKTLASFERYAKAVGVEIVVTVRPVK